ncbi:MAG: hypothetical protein ACOX52_19180 [Verrucomicrobiota bacterium]
MDRLSFIAELGQDRNNTVAAPGFASPNPKPRPFDSDSDPAPELASPLTFSDDFQPGRSLLGMIPFLSALAEWAGEMYVTQTAGACWGADSGIGSHVGQFYKTSLLRVRRGDWLT